MSRGGYSHTHTHRSTYARSCARAVRFCAWCRDACVLEHAHTPLLSRSRGRCDQVCVSLSLATVLFYTRLHDVRCPRACDLGPARKLRGEARAGRLAVEQARHYVGSLSRKGIVSVSCAPHARARRGASGSLPVCVSVPASLSRRRRGGYPKQVDILRTFVLCHRQLGTRTARLAAVGRLLARAGRRR